MKCWIQVRMRSLRVLMVLVVLVVPSLGSPCLHQHCLEDCVKERALEESCTQYCDICRYSNESGRLRKRRDGQVGDIAPFSYIKHILSSNFIFCFLETYVKFLLVQRRLAFFTSFLLFCNPISKSKMRFINISNVSAYKNIRID